MQASTALSTVSSTGGASETSTVQLSQLEKPHLFASKPDLKAIFSLESDKIKLESFLEISLQAPPFLSLRDTSAPSLHRWNNTSDTSQNLESGLGTEEEGASPGGGTGRTEL